MNLSHHCKHSLGCPCLRVLDRYRFCPVKHKQGKNPRNTWFKSALFDPCLSTVCVLLRINWEYTLCMDTYFIPILIAVVICGSSLIRQMIETCKFTPIFTRISNNVRIIVNYLHIPLTDWRHSSTVGRSSIDLHSILLTIFLCFSSHWRMKWPVLIFWDSPIGSFEYGVVVW